MENIKFKHFRYLTDDEGQTFDTKGGTTVAFVDETPEKGDGQPHTFRYAVAHCHEKDNFNRRIGRLISSGRLKKGMDQTLVCMPQDLHDQLILRAPSAN